MVTVVVGSLDYLRRKWRHPLEGIKVTSGLECRLLVARKGLDVGG